MATIKPDKTDLKTATANRKEIEAALFGGGVCTLPAGLVALDRQVEITPSCSFGTLSGQGLDRTVLKALYEDGQRPYTLWAYGGAIDPMTQGTSLGDLSEGAFLSIGALKPGLYYITQGKSYLEGNYQSDMTGEFRTALPLGLFDRPLRRSYLAANRPDGNPAYAVPANVVRGLTIQNLTLAQPLNDYACPFLGKYLYDCCFERVGFGLPEERNMLSNLNTSAYVNFIDCQTPTRFSFNTSHDCKLVGGRWAGIYGEESCMDCLLADLIANVSGRPSNGVLWVLGSERLVLRNVRVEGCGHAAIEGGAYMPLNVNGRECVLQDVTVAGSTNINGLSWSYLSGDGYTIERLRSDLPVALTGGKGWRLRDCDVAGWDLRDGTSGTASGCPGVPASW
jgi:hypothetical protein